MRSVYVEIEVKAKRYCCLLKGSGCVVAYARIQMGREKGVQTPLKNDKNMGFLSNTGLDPLKNYKATNTVLDVGLSSARFYWYLDPIFPHQLKQHKNIQ